MTDGSISDNGRSSDRERATRDSYDAIAEAYADWIADELTARPHDRAVLGAFSELVLATGSPDVLDIGCGPGRITAFLAALGLSPRGLDLSPAMVGLARDLPEARLRHRDDVRSSAFGRVLRRTCGVVFDHPHP